MHLGSLSRRALHNMARVNSNEPNPHAHHTALSLSTQSPAPILRGRRHSGGIAELSSGAHADLSKLAAFNGVVLANKSPNKGPNKSPTKKRQSHMAKQQSAILHTKHKQMHAANLLAASSPNKHKNKIKQSRTPQNPKDKYSSFALSPYLNSSTSGTSPQKGAKRRKSQNSSLLLGHSKSSSHISILKSKTSTRAKANNTRLSRGKTADPSQLPSVLNSTGTTELREIPYRRRASYHGQERGGGHGNGGKNQNPNRHLNVLMDYLAPNSPTPQPVGDARTADPALLLGMSGREVWGEKDRDVEGESRDTTSRPVTPSVCISPRPKSAASRPLTAHNKPTVQESDPSPHNGYTSEDSPRLYQLNSPSRARFLDPSATAVQVQPTKNGGKYGGAKSPKNGGKVSKLALKSADRYENISARSASRGGTLYKYIYKRIPYT